MTSEGRGIRFRHEYRVAWNEPLYLDAVRKNGRCGARVGYSGFLSSPCLGWWLRLVCSPS
jgi:hypothetical protein